MTRPTILYQSQYRPEKWDERSIIQSDNDKTPTTVSCVRRTQSSCPEILAVLSSVVLVLVQT